MSDDPPEQELWLRRTAWGAHASWSRDGRGGVPVRPDVYERVVDDPEEGAGELAALLGHRPRARRPRRVVVRMYRSDSSYGSDSDSVIEIPAERRRGSRRSRSRSRSREATPPMPTRRRLREQRAHEAREGALARQRDRTREVLGDSPRDPCHVCLEPITDPVIAGCGHVFCRPCIEAWLLHSCMPGDDEGDTLDNPDLGSCPSCRAVVIRTWAP